MEGKRKRASSSPDPPEASTSTSTPQPNPKKQKTQGCQTGRKLSRRAQAVVRMREKIIEMAQAGELPQPPLPTDRALKEVAFNCAPEEETQPPPDAIYMDNPPRRQSNAKANNKALEFFGDKDWNLEIALICFISFAFTVRQVIRLAALLSCNDVMGELVLQGDWFSDPDLCMSDADLWKLSLFRKLPDDERVRTTVPKVLGNLEEANTNAVRREFGIKPIRDYLKALVTILAPPARITQDETPADQEPPYRLKLAVSSDFNCCCQNMMTELADTSLRGIMAETREVFKDVLDSVKDSEGKVDLMVFNKREDLQMPHALRMDLGTHIINYLITAIAFEMEPPNIHLVEEGQVFASLVSTLVQVLTYQEVLAFFSTSIGLGNWVKGQDRLSSGPGVPSQVFTAAVGYYHEVNNEVDPHYEPLKTFFRPMVKCGIEILRKHGHTFTTLPSDHGDNDVDE
ncbi:hypothetical protein SISNIDRAFT_469332 [Sistotremastrum niveocremeum HHB9708]|uniref:Uncharacterized protein n=1 Tax=Sistotremastrum niveocremeum HHB9708 TaxID=1314777 RepID=A0A164Q355_9AGAM|nr:hypothetical protein SISNIDRAFT_469332 [Sistotremastrum niveocremeum HHB9708]